MNITRKTAEVRYIAKGKTFEFEGEHFMKVSLCSLFENPSDEYPVVNLGTGVVVPFKGDTLVFVTHMEAQIV